MLSRVHPIEVMLAIAPVGLFLAGTLPEILIATAAVFPEVLASRLPWWQALSGIGMWLCGAFCVGSLVVMVQHTIRGMPYKLGYLFSAHLTVGCALGWSLVAMFGLPLAAFVTVPPLLLAGHCWVVQQRI